MAELTVRDLADRVLKGAKVAEERKETIKSLFLGKKLTKQVYKDYVAWRATLIDLASRLAFKLENEPALVQKLDARLSASALDSLRNPKIPGFLLTTDAEATLKGLEHLKARREVTLAELGVIQVALVPLIITLVAVGGAFLVGKLTRSDEEKLRFFDALEQRQPGLGSKIVFGAGGLFGDAAQSVGKLILIGGGAIALFFLLPGIIRTVRGIVAAKRGQ